MSYNYEIINLDAIKTSENAKAFLHFMIGYKLVSFLPQGALHLLFSN